MKTTNKENPIDTLVQAIQEDNIEFVKTFLEKHNNINIDALSSEGISPLTAAALCGNFEIMEILFNNGANPDATDSHGSTALAILAAEKNSNEVIKFLIENNANVNTPNIYGAPPLYIATCHNNSEVVETLIQHNADIDSQTLGETPLQAAISEMNRPTVAVANRTEYKKIIQILLENGANADLKNSDGRTPLEHVTYLEERSFSSVFKGQGEFIARIASAIDGRADTQIIKKLMPEVRKILEEKEELLMGRVVFAINNKDTKAIKRLISKVKNVNEKDQTGSTLLMHAAKAQNLEAVQILITHQVDTNILNSEEQAALHLVTTDSNIVKILLQNGANPDAQDHQDYTPLYFAVEDNNISVVQTLIENGANINLQTYRAEIDELDNLFKLAERNQNEEITKMLVIADAADLITTTEPLDDKINYNLSAIEINNELSNIFLNRLKCMLFMPDNINTFSDYKNIIKELYSKNLPEILFEKITNSASTGYLDLLEPEYNKFMNSLEACIFTYQGIMSVPLTISDLNSALECMKITGNNLDDSFDATIKFYQDKIIGAEFVRILHNPGELSTLMLKDVSILSTLESLIGLFNGGDKLFINNGMRVSLVSELVEFLKETSTINNSYDSMPKFQTLGVVMYLLNHLPLITKNSDQDMVVKELLTSCSIQTLLKDDSVKILDWMKNNNKIYKLIINNINSINKIINSELEITTLEKILIEYQDEQIASINDTPEIIGAANNVADQI